MKKTLCVLLSLLLLATLCAPCFAELKKEEISNDPVIIVPGYGASALFRDEADGSATQVWGWNIFADIALQKVKEIAPQLLTGVSALTVGQAQVLGRVLGKAIAEMAEPLRCLPDGESAYPVHTLQNDPENCRWDHLKAAYGELYAEADIGNCLRDYAEDDRLFNLYLDFRKGAVENAAELDRYITAVKEYTGSDRVRLYAISHGGQVTATYLSLYGDKNDVASAVLTSPAVGGAGFAYDFINGQVALNGEELIRFIECALCSEYDFEWLVKAGQLGFADDILNAAVPYLHQAAYYWQSLWDFIPMDEFDACIERLDPAQSGKLINSTAYFHQEIMSRMGERLRACRENGTAVSVIAGAGIPIVTGYPRGSDGIITTAAATGALCAPYGERFANGYTCAGTVCADPAHNHLAPSMEIDASTAYLPENTWIVDGFFHGFTMNEPRTRELAMTLLFTDKIGSVHDDPAFPQFFASENKAYSVSGRFNRSPEGYLSDADMAFTVTNLSGDLSIRILSIRADGVDLTFEGDYGKTVEPHGSLSFAVKGSLPKVSAARAAVTVTYYTEKSVSPMGERILDFTLLNGEPAAFDPENPTCAADFIPPLGEKLGAFPTELLKKLGLFDWFSLLYNLMLRLLDAFRTSLALR